MPTTRPRHMITETDELRDTLDRAARIWPEIADDRAGLLRRIVHEGSSRIEMLDGQRRAQRLAAIHETSGSMSGIWPADAVQQMRDEWPE